MAKKDADLREAQARTAETEPTSARHSRASESCESEKNRAVVSTDVAAGVSALEPCRLHARVAKQDTYIEALEVDLRLSMAAQESCDRALQAHKAAPDALVAVNSEQEAKLIEYERMVHRLRWRLAVYEPPTAVAA